MNGLYVPRASALHRLNPLVKLAAVVPPVFVVTLVTDPWTSLAIVGLNISILLGWGRISPRQYIGSSVPMLLVAAGIALAYPLLASERVTAGSPAVLELGPLAIYEAGVRYGAASALRLYAMYSVMLLFAMTTGPADFVRAMMQQWKLSPRFGYGTLAVLRFLPVLRSELAVIREAHKVRGIATGRLHDKFAERFRRYMLPLLAAAIRRAERTSYAMDARGLGINKPRTFYKSYRYSAGDWLFLGGYWLATSALFAVMHYTGLMEPFSLLKLFG